jgi:hypothetical protein
VATTNTMIAGTGMEGKSVEDIIRYAYGEWISGFGGWGGIIV